MNWTEILVVAAIILGAVTYLVRQFLAMGKTSGCGKCGCGGTPKLPQHIRPSKS